MRRKAGLIGLVLLSLGVATPAMADRSGSDPSGTHSYTLTCVDRKALFTNTSTAEEDSNILITDDADPFPDNLRYNLAVGETGELNWTRVFGGVNWHVYWSPGGSGDPATWIEIDSGEENYPAICVATAPSAPRALVAAPGNASVKLSWEAPASNGGAMIETYAVLYRRAGETVWTPTFIPGSETRSHNVTGLTNGVRYEFRVFAINRIGASPDALASATPRTVPSPPRSLSAVPGNRVVTLRWSSPSSTGGTAITGYAVQRSTNGRAWTTVNVPSTARSYRFTDLTNGTRHQFRVLARNSAGPSAPSNVVTAVPRTTATSPRALAAKAGNHRVRLTWQAPFSNGGAAVERYVVQQRRGNRGWVTIERTPKRALRVTGLRNGQRYSYRVAAVNAAGRGVWSRTASAVPHR